jgi:hypothetical protein
LEAKGLFDSELIGEIRKESKKYFLNIQRLGDENANKVYGDSLLTYINDENENNIKLTKVRYH